MQSFITKLPHMYYLNEKLVRAVSRLWGMTRKEFSAFALDSAQLYAQRMAVTHWSRLTVNDIVKIANATHIPICHFFVQSEEGYVPSKKEDIVFKGKWQEISINIPFIEYVYKHDDEYSRAAIKKCTGVTKVAFYNWFRGNCNMKAQQACDFCNHFHCDIKNIVNDPNEVSGEGPTGNHFGCDIKSIINDPNEVPEEYPAKRKKSQVPTIAERRPLVKSIHFTDDDNYMIEYHKLQLLRAGVSRKDVNAENVIYFFFQHCIKHFQNGIPVEEFCNSIY